MRIDFIRTGGFAGIQLTTSVETTQLPPDQATTLHKLVDEANFFQQPASIMPDKPAPDRFQYELTVASAEQTHTVVCGDPAIPSDMRPLLNYLTTMAMVSKKS